MNNTKPAWHDAPTWATCLFQTADGAWIFSDTTPYPEGGMWVTPCPAHQVLMTSKPGQSNANWQNTLEFRPDMKVRVDVKTTGATASLHTCPRCGEPVLFPTDEYAAGATSGTKFFHKACLQNNKPSWRDAPGWAQYLAQDADGYWHWYEKLPRAGQSFDEWLLNVNHDGCGEYFDAGEGPKNPNWRDTLEARPAKEGRTFLHAYRESLHCLRELLDAEHDIAHAILDHNTPAQVLGVQRKNLATARARKLLGEISTTTPNNSEK